MKNSLLVHKHLIVRAESIKPPKDEEQLKEWMKEFVDSINMKIFMGPYVKYCNMEGNRGITAVAIIETSHIAMHIWDEVSPALMQFDVYSCSELNVENICNKIKQDFNIEKIEYKFLNRETGLKIFNYNTSIKSHSIFHNPFIYWSE
jgi:S-adenosylmethionine/arginine decarboxylase-like enzyme